MRQEHLDPDTMAALAGHALTDAERAAAFLHLAECEECRDCLAVFGKLIDHARPVGPLYAKTAAAVVIAALAGWLTSSTPRPPRAANQRNPSRIYQQAKLADFSFVNEPSIRHRKPSPAGNQIAVMTALGERWITISGIWDRPHP